MNAIEFTKPFRHWRLTGVLPAELASTARDSVPPASWDGWVRYSSAFESGKRTSRKASLLPGPVVQALGELQSVEFTDELRKLSGIGDLVPSPFLHGGGLHVTEPGGKLDPHIDFAKHPQAPFLERRLSLIVFLTSSPGFGRLLLWNDDVSQIVAEYQPQFNTAIMFENSDLSYHSVSANSGPDRVTLAAYYCAPIRPGVVRKRALWAPIRA